MESRMKLPLFDDYWIDFRYNAHRRWFAPEPYSLSPAGPYASMFYDPEREAYRIYYEVIEDFGNDDQRQLKMVESKDLKTFTPVLNDEGSDVLYYGESGIHGASVLYDPFDPDPARRYKFCGMTRMERCRKGGKAEIEVAFSADGIHWVNNHDYIAHPTSSDALNKLIYNPLKQEYCLFHRAAAGERRICIKTSKDLQNWTESRTILHPGPNYNDGETNVQHYSMSSTYMDGIFYGLLWHYNTSRYDMNCSHMFGYIEPELVYSYDGNEYLYTTGKPLMERPLPPEPGCVGLAPDDICESADGKDYYIICYGYVFVHGTAENNKRLMDAMKDKEVKTGNPIYKIRKDGFCGIESVGHGGKVVTKGIQLLKDDLSFNIRANYGFVRFGIMNINGEFIEGFSFDDCIPFEYDDSVDVRPQWKEHKLEELIDRRVRIAVELNTAILHCISATARPFIWQPQVSFADPKGLPRPW